MDEYNKFIEERKDMEDYERRIKSRVVNLIDCKDELDEKILQKQLNIILNREPSKLCLIEKK
jgi:hypothetical protein